MPIGRRLMQAASQVGKTVVAIYFSYDGSSAWAGGFNNCADIAADKAAQTDKTAVITGGDVFGYHVSDASTGAGLGYTWHPANSGLLSQIHGLGMAFSPFVDKRVYLQYGIGNSAPNVSGGLAVSTDGGHSWNIVNYTKNGNNPSNVFGNVTGAHPRAVGNTIHVVQVSSTTILRVGCANGINSLIDPGGAIPTISLPAVSNTALTNAVCPSIAPYPQDDLVTYVAVRENWGASGTVSPQPAPGLYKVTWSADGYSSYTAQQITNSNNTAKLQPGRVDRIVTVVENGVTVVYAGTDTGIMRYPTNRGVNGGCDNWSGTTTGQLYPSAYTTGGICAVPMSSGPTIVYAGISPLTGSPSGSHVFRTIDGGVSWQAVDQPYQKTVYGDASGDTLYCFNGNTGFLPDGSGYDIGTFKYIQDPTTPANTWPKKDRFLVFGRTCYGDAT